ncbi:unnamed protein product [Dovyalis caffra]|uniref:Uncharacterized protein n=1 Tax=Dovyalis caffra TaxID=77055 RepID=A0AAV1QSN1_9ROSI|nr:unnamed protein product [Dovyalis caffra]
MAMIFLTKRVERKVEINSKLVKNMNDQRHDVTDIGDAFPSDALLLWRMTSLVTVHKMPQMS